MPPSSITCLVVEPDSERAKSILGYLKSSDRRDFLCYQAATPLEAKKILIKTRVDLVISKGVIAESDDVDIAIRYRNDEHNPIVICLLEDEEKSVVFDADSSCADDFIFYKDLNSKGIHEAIQHAIDRRELLTELKQVRAGPHDGRGLYRGLLHNLDLALFLVSRPEGEILFSNTVAEAWFQGFRESMLAELFEYGVLDSELVECEIETSSTLVPWAELRSVKVEWKGRECSLLALRNISKRKRAEDAYKASQRRLELALKASNLGLWSWDLRENRLHFSERWKAQLGFVESEFPNTLSALRLAIHPEDLVEVDSVFGRVLRGEINEVELKYRMRHRDGNFLYVLCRAEVFPDESGKLSTLLGSHIDLSNRNEEVCSSSSDVTLVEKIRLRKEQIASEVEGRAAKIRTDFRGDSQIATRIQDLERLSRSFLCLNEVLQSAQGYSVGFDELLDLNATAEALYENLSSLVLPNVQIELCSSEHLYLRGISRRVLELVLTEALLCVMQNVSRDVRCRIRILLGTCEPREGMKISPFIEYHYGGSRIDETELQALSETPRVKISVGHDGAFSTLKLIFDSSISIEPKPESRSPLALLAEDESVLGIAIRAMLETLGFEVELAEDGARAVELFERREVEFDLALVDLQIPVVDGRGVINAIRSIRSDLPVICMSGDLFDERCGLGSESGEITCFLSKPFGIAELKVAVEKLSMAVTPVRV